MKLEIKHLNAVRFIKLFIAASRWVGKYSDVLNDLNVYPVPDGDTGTNMSMTFQAVETELMKLNHEPSMPELTDIVSEAILLGARGNSGTILSQIIQGFMSHIKDKEVVTIDDVAAAFVVAKERAYESVSEPVEGTILSVIRRVSEAAVAYQGSKDDFILFLVHLKNVANDAVNDTPNQLKKLKEAGVVDAGGKGIFYMLEGFEKSVTDPEMLRDLERIVKSQAMRREKLENEYVAFSVGEIKYKYCTEFIIETSDIDLDKYKKHIEKMGDSIVCAKTDKKVKTHIHTNNPGDILEYGLKHGALTNVKIENMEIQHKNILLETEEKIATNEPRDKFMYNSENINPVAYFAVAENRTMGDLFLSAGASLVVVGGQGKNPSVEDFETGIARIASDKIIILPNNKNIISAAKLAAKRSKKDVLVIETKTMLEGHHMIVNRYESLERTIFQSGKNYSIEITRAIKDSASDGIEIKTGDVLILVNNKIVDAVKSIKTALHEVEKKYIPDNAVKVTVGIGAGVTEENNLELKNLKNNIKGRLQYKEVNTAQENYPYYIYVATREDDLPEIAIVTDSTADLPDEVITEHRIEVVPLKIKIGNDEFYREGVDITKDEFWNKITTENVYPKTSQPSPAEFKSMYEKLLNKGYKKIYSIHISGKLSGTQHAARVGRGMLKDRASDIIIVDSKAVAFTLGNQVEQIAKMFRANKTEEEVMASIDELQKNDRIYCVVNDLSYLIKGGRLSRHAGYIGKLLNLKPILKIEDGEVVPVAKVFGEERALNYLKKLVKTEAQKREVVVTTGWGGTYAENAASEKLREELGALKNVELKDRVRIGASIGSHAGPVYGVGVSTKI